MVTGSSATPGPTTPMTLGRSTPLGTRCRANFFAAERDGVAGVGAAVVADGHVEALGEQIDDLAFSFVTPAQTDDAGVSEFGEIHGLAPRPPPERDAREATF